MKQWKFAAGISLCALFLTAGTGSTQAQQYSVLDIGSFGIPDTTVPGGYRHSNTHVYGLNNKGQAVGDSGLQTGTYLYYNQLLPVFNTHGFRTAPNTTINRVMDDLGAFYPSTSAAPPGSASYARGINDSGQVVGWSSSIYSYFHAFRTAANSAINLLTDDLGTNGEDPRTTQVYAYGINNRGEVSGNYESTSLSYPPVYRFSPNNSLSPSMTLVGGGGSGNFGAGPCINNKGRVGYSGYSYYSSSPDRGYLSASTDLSETGTFIGEYLDVAAVNDAGQVAGSNGGSAFRTAPKGIADFPSLLLGTLNGYQSFAYGINNQGDVVGYSSTPNSGHAFVYRNGNLFDLNELIPSGANFVLEEARAINNSGQIAVNGYTLDVQGFNSGEAHAYVLTPTTASKNYLSVTASGLVYNRSTRTYNATLTVTNTAIAPIYGPLQVEVSNITPGATLTNFRFMHNGNPYITLTDTTKLLPGASVSIPVQFSYAGIARLGYAANAYSQGF